MRRDLCCGEVSLCEMREIMLSLAPTSRRGKSSSDGVLSNIPFVVSGAGEYGKRSLRKGHTVDVRRQARPIIGTASCVPCQSIKVERIGVSKEAMQEL